MDRLDLGAEYNKIASFVVGDGGGTPDRLYLYVEAEHRAIGGAIFRDVGDKVYYISCSHELFMAILEFWESLPPDQQWTAMHMDIEQGRFDAHFDFIEGAADEEEDGFGDRQEAALAARFGNKEIIYPAD